MSDRFVLYLISWLATVSAGYAATLVSVYLPALTQSLYGTAGKADVAQVGSWAGASFLGGWAIGAFFLGALTDKIGRKKGLVLAITLNAAGMLASAFAGNLAVLSFSRCLTGAGAGAILLITAVIVAEAFANDKRRAVLLGILINAFPVGFILAGIMHGTVNDFALSCMIGGVAVVLAIAAWTVVQESALWKKSEADKAAAREARRHVFDAAYRKDLVVGLLLFGSMLVGLWASYAWMPAWISSISDPASAAGNRATTSIMLGAGAVVGGIISGWVSDKLGRKRAVGLGYVCVLAVSIVTFTQFTSASPMLFVLTFVLSMCVGFNQGVLTGYIPELFPTLVRGAATGLAFNVGRLITAGTVFSIGTLVSVFNNSYSAAMLTFASFYIVGLLTLFAARETHGRHLPS